MINETVLKGMGLAVGVIGYAISIAASIISAKQLDMQIERKVMEHLQNQ